MFSRKNVSDWINPALVLRHNQPEVKRQSLSITANDNNNSLSLILPQQTADTLDLDSFTLYNTILTSTYCAVPVFVFSSKCFRGNVGDVGCDLDSELDVPLILVPGTFGRAKLRADFDLKVPLIKELETAGFVTDEGKERLRS